jgi:hypothetical protein
MLIVSHLFNAENVKVLAILLQNVYQVTSVDFVVKIMMKIENDYEKIGIYLLLDSTNRGCMYELKKVVWHNLSICALIITKSRMMSTKDL